MKTKETKIKRILKAIIYVCVTFLIFLYMIIFFKVYIPVNKTYAKETSVEAEEIKISEAKSINLDEIIEKNTNEGRIEKITKNEEILEYITKYKTNNKIPKGISYVVQEGREGKQQITTKTIYDKEGNVINEEQVEAIIVKASLNKIIEIGGANYTSNYKAKTGDVVYVTSNILGMWSEPNEESRKITTLKKNEELKILEISKNWYKIKYNSNTGWVKAECTIYSDLINEKNEEINKSKQELINTLNFNMQLNKPSGLTLEQFKKIFNDEKDVNKIFLNNAEYLYYIEKQYNINGVFVGAVGIHESAWGTSKIALQKNNLFGYGAYDSNPYNGAYEFSNYSECIDLIARVFVKYYLNPKGTSIYDGEKAKGTYYNGPTLTGVNTKYATDKKWANAVYMYIKYLYNKL